MTETQTLPATDIRTGHVIRTEQGRVSRPLFSLEVAYTHRELFRSPEGIATEVVRFSGQELYTGVPTGKWVEAGYGQPVGARVYVVEDLREYAYLSYKSI